MVKPKKEYKSWTEKLNLVPLSELGTQWWVIRVSRINGHETAEVITKALVGNYPDFEFKTRRHIFHPNLRRSRRRPGVNPSLIRPRRRSSCPVAIPQPTCSPQLLTSMPRTRQPHAQTRLCPSADEAPPPLSSLKTPSSTADLPRPREPSPSRPVTNSLRSHRNTRPAPSRRAPPALPTAYH
ncbi:uncharacterized protein A4U43_C10F13100 [Asparagus officinalis]|uniref:Uncharacterized protein n=1 Tax=Asparagus officinalis TaxID=4686 RepID=A0A5P1E2Q7_ASPOF|nr:uncharacterized protein A4U43_C10F13100 [Asparagus officinalis]